MTTRDTLWANWVSQCQYCRAVPVSYPPSLQPARSPHVLRPSSEPTAR